jgi:hypothetical protein
MESDSVATTGDIVLCVPKGWGTYLSREFHEIHAGLVELGWKLLIVEDTGDQPLLDAIYRARCVLLWECYELLERQWESLSALPKEVTRIAFCDDVHYFTAHRQAQRRRAFDWAHLILATYPHKLAEWFPDTCKNVKWTPHAAASYFTPAFAPASDKILLSGSRTWPYPFRQFCAQKLPLDVCEVLDHPGYPGYPGDRANQWQANPQALAEIGGPRYAALLRRYPAMLVCGSMFGYLVAKVFEGMAAGCLIIADRASLGSQLDALGFHEGEHYIGTDIFHVIEDAAAVQRLFTGADPRWAAITERAERKVRERHTTAQRARDIHALCMAEAAK